MQGAGRLLSATTFYGPASNATSHGHMRGLMGLAFNGGILLSSQDPHPIAEIPSDPRSIPYCSSDSIPTILWYSDITLTKTLNSKYPQTLQHISYRSPNSKRPWKTLITFCLHLSSSFCFSPLELQIHFHVFISVFTFLFSVYWTISVLSLSHSSFRSTIIH